MNEFREPTEGQVANPILEIHTILDRMQVEGAMDEEGPFIHGLLRKIDCNELSPAEALKQLRAKMASRNDYH